MESTKQKISKALKGRKVTWESKGPKGYKYTEEQKPVKWWLLIPPVMLSKERTPRF